MINKSDFYLKDIDLLKQLQPIMAKKGIEADGYINIKDNASFGFLAPYIDQGFTAHEGEYYDQNDGCGCCSESVLLETGSPTYRKDSLESALPEWCFDNFCSMNELLIKFHRMNRLDITLYFCEQMSILIYKARRPGQVSLEALAQLIILLDKELNND